MITFDSNMLKAIEAIIDSNGNVKLLEKVRLAAPQRAIVTILNDSSEDSVALLSEASLSKDWLSPEEEEAWKALQKDQ